MRGKGRWSQRPASHLRSLPHLLAALAIVASALTIGTAVQPVQSASADTAYTYPIAPFTSGTFPPTNWQVAANSSTWAADCTLPTPMTGCGAQATITGGFIGLTELLFNPPAGIPSNIENPTLSFYSDFAPDATTVIDRVTVAQAPVQGDTGDSNQLVNIANAGGVGDATGVPVLHTIALPSDHLPLFFRWSSAGDASSTPTSSWDISNVTITGTLPSTTYSLSANPVPNTANKVTAGTPVTIHLSGTSKPAGDDLTFEVDSPPSLGSTGAVTRIDGNDASVVYTPRALACPDPNGGTFQCEDSFTYTASDVEGNVSPPATVNLDVMPGGAAGEVPAISAPATASYGTLNESGVGTVQGIDLDGEVSLGPSTFPDRMEVELQVPTGSMELSNAAGNNGVTVLSGNTNGDTVIDLSGSVKNLNLALKQFLYFPPTGTTPSNTITILAWDLGPFGAGPRLHEAQSQIEINGIVTAAPPSLSVPTNALAVSTDTTLVFSGSGNSFTLTDTGASDGTQDEVLLSVDGGSLSLPGADTSGPTQLVTAQSFVGGATLDLTGTVANLDLALNDLTFSPNNLPSGSVTLSARAIDPDTGLASSQGTFTITVTQAPFAFGPGVANTLLNTPVVVFLCADGPGTDPLTYQFTTRVADGILAADPSASTAGAGCLPANDVSAYLYTPTNGFTGTDSFSYTVTDTTTGLVSGTNTLTITVQAPPTPTAYAVSATTVEDASVNVELCGQNPQSGGTPTLTFTITSPPTNGSLVDQGPPTVNSCAQGNVADIVTYTPYAGTFTNSGTDAFGYDVSNGSVSAPVMATITVNTLTPQVVSTAASVDENGDIGLNLCAATSTGPLSFSVTGPSHGTIDQQVASTTGPACPSGFLSLGYEHYTPSLNYSGPDLIDFTATDGLRTSSQALVSITVTKVEVPPTATAQTVTDIAPHPVAITLSGASTQGSALTFSVITNPTHGTLSGTAPDLIFTPSIASGTDSFTFVANDGTANSVQPATVTITIVTPHLSSSVCVAGASIGPNQDSCASALTAVSNGTGGTISLAHTNGGTGAQRVPLTLQETITNTTTAPDTVTVTASAGVAPWSLLYDLAGQDVTAAITTTGSVVTLGPAGSATASAYIQVVVIAPQNFPAPPSTTLTVTALSGNDPTVSTVVPLEVADGTSTPTLSLAQSNGSGVMTFPNALNVSPVLYSGGPTGTALITPGLTGTGDNTFRVSATVTGSQGITAQYFLVSTDVTAQVLAGTEVIQCYAGIGCPPMHVVLTPGTGPGSYGAIISLTSTVDGQGVSGLLDATLAGSIGPDLYSSLPNLGQGVFEATPVTQVASRPVETSGTASQGITLYNQGDVSDTYTVKAAVTQATGDTGRLTLAANGVDVTAALESGTYAVTVAPGQSVSLAAADAASATTGLAPASVVLTATSALETSKVDSFEVTFPTYFYRPDAILSGANGQPIGAGVYSTSTNSITSATLNPQTDEYDVSFSPTTIDVSLIDNGGGPWPALDKVVVTSPATDANFTLTYALLENGTTTDVTSAITGSGLPLSLGTAAQGATAPILAVTAVASPGAQAGHPGSFPIIVSSSSSIPSGLSDVVVIGLYNTGQSQLRFGGLPQAEPADITATVNADHLTRVAPFPSAGYAAGATYGAYPDATGQKFVYASAYDNFSLQVAGEKVSATPYRVQVVDPGRALTGLPAWEQVAFSSPYDNNGVTTVPADPLAAGSGLNPTFTVGGVNVTAGLENGTYTTPALGTNQTMNIGVSFNATGSQRYLPLKFNLINALTGQIEDVLVIDLSSIVTCSSDGYDQHQAVIQGPNGEQRLNFEAWNRLNPQDPNQCFQHLSNSWITTDPVVFTTYSPATYSPDTPNGLPAGGDAPVGLWLLPQQNGVVQIDANTLDVTSPSVKVFIDSPILGADGTPDPSAAAAGMSNYYFVGNYSHFNWATADPRNGIEINTGSSGNVIPQAPFPLITPDNQNFPGSTMAAARYFQVDPSTGAPVMVGEMSITVPWFSGSLAFTMNVTQDSGLTLDYPAPANTQNPLPNAPGVFFQDVYYWTDNGNQTLEGGCLGIPGEMFTLLGLDGGPSICILGFTATFADIPGLPGALGTVSKVTIQLINPGIGAEGSPEFNLNSISGEIDFDPVSQDVTKVVLDPVFGVGPPTPCQVTSNKGLLSGALEKFVYLGCPTNYFFFSAKVTIQAGGFDNSTSGFGIQFNGTLSFLNVISLANIEVDISSDPFNFHFADSPVDVTISPSVPIEAHISLSGDVNDTGFDIALSGGVSIYGYTIASAAGVISTKGFGLCGTLADISMGVGDTWGSTPTLYASGCTTSQYDVGETGDSSNTNSTGST